MLRRAAALLRHRGPDDEGFYFDRGIALGNRRLSIIDLAGGHQPIHNEDESLWCVNNGEIYNYGELQRELEASGHRFYTQSDTEVLVHAYEAYGTQFSAHLNGMFAAAIWDARRKRLVLARDPVGIKPLFYHRSPVGELWFASEIKALLATLEQPPSPDPVAFHALLNLGFVPGERTLFAGIRKLMPGHTLVFEDGQVTLAPYWSLPQTNQSFTYEAAVAMLQQLLRTAVERHLISDVPVGAFLSAGLDTSTVVALASRAYGGKLATFTLGFGEATDELVPARATAELFGTAHHEEVLELGELARHLPTLIWHADAPKFNLYPYFIAKFASRHVRVVLSGMGGDELFGGYVYRYRHFRRVMHLQRLRIAALAALAARGVSRLLRNPGGRLLRRVRALEVAEDPTALFLRIHGVLAPAEWSVVGGPALLAVDQTYLRGAVERSFREADSLLDGALRAEFSTKLVEDFLLVDDAMTMAHGLEERVPLLDRGLVEFAFRLPMQYKVRNGIGKYVFRDAVAPFLPGEIRRRGKWGFSLNLASWFEGEVRELARQVLEDGYLVREGYLNSDYVNSLARTRPGGEREARMAWSAMLSELWYRLYFVRGAESSPPALEQLL